MIVNHIIKGDCTIRSLLVKYSLVESQVKRWYHYYQRHGINGLRPSNNSYSFDYKLNVIKFMNKNSLSLGQTCIEFNIHSTSILSRWLSIYKREGVIGLRKENRGRTVSMPKKPKKHLSREEQLLEELADLKAENAYLKKLHALVQSEKVKEEKRKSSKN
jgi:transposase